MNITPTTKNVSMTAWEEAVVTNYKRERGFRSFSAAWSQLLREWLQLTGRPTDNDTPTPPSVHRN